MNSPHTFVGKVFTLLVGGGLSWLTVMHPPFERSMATLLGDTERTAKALVAVQPIVGDPTVAPSASSLMPYGAPQAHGTRAMGEVPVLPFAAGRSTDVGLQIDQISDRLRAMGASYLLLERIPNPSGDRYRARCDLAQEHSAVKCCFEVVRGTAVDAMRDVLHAVRNMESSPPRIAAPVGAST